MRWKSDVRRRTGYRRRGTKEIQKAIAYRSNTGVGLVRLDGAIRVFDGAVGAPPAAVRQQIKDIRKRLGMVRNERLLR